MKKIILVFLFVYAFGPLFGQDFSSPQDGNLFIETESPFIPERIQIYDDGQILIEKNIILNNDRIYANAPNQPRFDITNRTINTDLAWIDDTTCVALTGNSERYAHGILGDKIESTGFAVYKDGKVVSQFELSNDRVFETLRPLVADLIPENPGKEIILTSSNEREGARVDIYSQSGLFIGQSSPIGRGYRWLHILGVAPFNDTQRPYLAIVKTPHINGTLELLHWNGESLETEISLKNVSTHQIRSSNLNMALLINMDNTSDSELLIPSFDFRNLLVIKFKDNELKVIKKFELPKRISTNIYYDEGNSTSVWLGLSDGSIVNIE